MIPSSSPAATTLAVLNVESPQLDKLMPLLEVRVADLPDVVPLDRAALQEVLKEQQLQAALAADATGQRAALGKALKADLLVLLQARDKPQPHAQLIVFETGRGLRLCVEPIILSADPEADSRAMLEPIQRALAKHRQKITEIVAIPPFLDDSLSRDHEYLSGMLPKLLERELLRQEGVLVVELDEAKAIAREATLSGREGGVRQLPLYLLGEYRVEIGGEDRQASFSLKLKRGERQLDDRAAKEIPHMQLAPRIQTAAKELLDGTIGKQPAPTDPATEGKQLAERAHAFKSLGNWREALALYEASLLLQPDQPAIHGEAAYVIDKLLDETRPFSSRDVELQIQTLEKMRPALVHLEKYLLGTKLAMAPRVGEKSVWIVPQTWWYRRVDPQTQSHLEALNSFDREHMEMVNRVLEFKSTNRVHDGTLFLLADYSTPHVDINAPDFKQWLNQHLSAYLERRMKLVDAFVWLELDGGQWSWFLVAPGYPMNICDPECAPAREAYAKFLKQIETKPNPKLAAAATHLLNQLARQANYKPPQKLPAIKPARRDPKEIDVVLHPLSLDLAKMEGNAGPAASRILNWQPVDSSSDILTTFRSLFLLKSDEKLIRLPFERNPGPDLRPKLSIAGFCCDNRYAWVVSPGDKPVLAAIDLTSQQIWKLTAKDGLPPMPADKLVALSAIAPGEIGIAGYFGRLWCGNATVDPKKGISLKVFFEARTQQDYSDPTQQPTEVASEVRSLHTISGRIAPDKPVEHRLLLMRSWGQGLLINPRDGSAVEEPKSHACETIPCALEGSVYWGYRDGKAWPDGVNRFVLNRIGFPELKSTVVNRSAPGDKYLVHEAEILAVPEHGSTLFIARNFADEFQPLREETSDRASYTRAWISHLHGLVVARDAKLFRLERVNR